MARARRRLTPALVMGGLTCPVSRRWARGVSCVVWFLAALSPRESTAATSVASDTARSGIGGSSMPAENGSLLLDYFTTFAADRDAVAFQNRVAARYSEATLCRVASSASDSAARRAAVLALGLLGSFEHSNAVLGKALRDSDVAVRTIAEDSLWAIWFRAGTSEQNRILSQVRLAISRRQLDQAEHLVTRLIEVAPNFAEAYNQRAIIYFFQGRFADSMSDCQSVLARNPYHFGAISGMAQCQLQLDRPRDALKSLRRALNLQPHRASLRDDIRLLELQIESDGAH
jgi:tetratricopeptide (TPR) repeat protein